MNIFKNEKFYAVLMILFTGIIVFLVTYIFPQPKGLSFNERIVLSLISTFMMMLINTSVLLPIFLKKK